MKVRIGGKEVERTSHVIRLESGQLWEEPELEEGEFVVWALGDPIPTIIQGQTGTDIDFRGESDDDG